MRKNKNIKFLKIFILFLLFLLFFVYKNINSSVFFKKKEKINVVFYGKNTFYISLSKNTNYLIKIPVDAKILIPGGYGYYRNGALGKLVFLEKKPDLIRKTFSGVTSSFVDLYFYSNKDKIYYSDDFPDFNFPDFRVIFFYSSNANFLDRLILFFKIFSKKISDFNVIEINWDFIDQDKFSKKYFGIFYKKKYREKMTTVQIFYNKSYSTAYFLSQIISGEGIRVVDISQKLNSKNQKSDFFEKCLIIENSNSPTDVAVDLIKFFNCHFQKGETEISDIILILKNLEKDWAVK